MIYYIVYLENMKNIDEQLKIIRHGASEIIQEDDLIEKLKSKKKLIIKAGLDPTMPDMHLATQLC